VFYSGILAKKGQSINTTVIDLLKKGIGLQMEANKKRDFSFISGTWTQEESDEFQKNITFCESIDKNIWKK
jgi:hypothetical protein